MNLMDKVNSDWDTWKNFLGQAVEFAEEIGIPRDRIALLAQQAGEVLAESIPPGNPEQQVLKELWKVSDQQEKLVLAQIMTKLCRR